jgi:signal transduction histidine kinase
MAKLGKNSPSQWIIGWEVAHAADRQSLLELAARAPTQLAGAVGATVLLFDPARKSLNLDMAWGLSDSDLVQLRRRLKAEVSPQTCQGCNAHLLADCPFWEGIRLEGIETILCLPLAGREECHGYINAYFSPAAPPKKEHLPLLTAAAGEVAAALDGEQLRREQVAAVSALEHLTRIDPDLSDLLNEVLTISLAGWQVEQGAVLLYDPDDGGRLRWAQRGLGEDPHQPQFKLIRNLAEETLAAGEPILISDLSRHLILGPRIINGIRSAAAAPLLAGDEPLGALVLASARPNFFGQRDLHFFSAVAHQAALTLQNARLRAQVRQLATLEERQRLSREMHDSLAQTLGYLGWQLDHLKMAMEQEQSAPEMTQKLDDIRQMTRDAYQEVREAIDGLRLTVNHPGGLTAALAEYVAEFEARTGIAAQLQTAGAEFPLLPYAESQLLRLVQESLTNVRKHAQASRVEIHLQHLPDRFELTISDNGRGFEPHPTRHRRHMGLTGMRERVQSLNGSLSLATRPGAGTRLTVTIPLEREAPTAERGQPL